MNIRDLKKRYYNRTWRCEIIRRDKDGGINFKVVYVVPKWYGY